MIFEFSLVGFKMACAVNVDKIFSTSFETGFFIVSWVLSYSLLTKLLMFLLTLKGHLEVLRRISIHVPKRVLFIFTKHIGSLLIYHLYFNHSSFPRDEKTLVSTIIVFAHCVGWFFFDTNLSLRRNLHLENCMKYTIL